MKTKVIYLCNNCGYQSPKWIGKCPDCNEWNTFQEEQQIIPNKKNSISQSKFPHTSPNTAISLNHNFQVNNQRINLKYPGLNTVLGGGLKVGSMILLSGEPGIGKSTLTLEISADIAKENLAVLYISGEESTLQIAERAKRLKIQSENISLLSETCLENILSQINTLNPKFLVIDSIQVLYSLELSALPGSISQIRYCTERLMEICKGQNISCLIIGHVNKDGDLAGPKVLEHLVDTVLFIEGERHQHLRIIRGLKNRFGSTNEITIMEMVESGLEEIKNPSEIFLQGRKKDAIGSAITVTLEGSHPLILEVQALTNHTVFGYPKRTASGFDINRLQLLSAVLQKFLKINLNSQDIFVNIIGGFKLQETAVDLSIAAAIISSFKKIPLPEKTVFLGEIGLSGELRPASHINKRIKEAEKLGFTTIITAKSDKPLKANKAIKIIELEDIEKVAKLLFT